MVTVISPGIISTGLAMVTDNKYSLAMISNNKYRLAMVSWNAPSPPLVLLTALCETEKCDEEKIGFDQEPIFTQPTIAGLWNSKVCWIHCSPQTDGQEVV